MTLSPKDPAENATRINRQMQRHWRGPFNKTIHFIHVPGDRRHPYLHGCCGRCHGDRHSQTYSPPLLVLALLCIHHNKRYHTSSHVVEMIFVREKTKKERERESLFSSPGLTMDGHKQDQSSPRDPAPDGFTLVKLGKTTQGLCLDGSVGGYYIKKGDPKKVSRLVPSPIPSCMMIQARASCPHDVYYPLMCLLRNSGSCILKAVDGASTLPTVWQGARHTWAAPRRGLRLGFRQWMVDLTASSTPTKS